jgi:hypothetical protein
MKISKRTALGVIFGLLIGSAFVPPSGRAVNDRSFELNNRAFACRIAPEKAQLEGVASLLIP